MNDADCETETLRKNTHEEVDKCTDKILLDLVYKLLIT